MAKQERSDGTNHIGIALCGLSRFIDDIVTELVRDVPSVDVVARLPASADLDADLARSGADVLVCALPDAEMSALWRGALARRPPPLAVLNLVDDNRKGCLLTVYPDELVLDDVTEASLLELLRRRVRPASGPDLSPLGGFADCVDGQRDVDP